MSLRGTHKKEAARCQLPERRARHPAFHTSPAAANHPIIWSSASCPSCRPLTANCGRRRAPAERQGAVVSGQAHQKKQEVVGRYAQGGRGRGASLLEGFPLGPQLPQLPLVAAAAQEVDVLRRRRAQQGQCGAGYRLSSMDARS